MPVTVVMLVALTVGNVQALVCQEPSAPDSKALSCLAPVNPELLKFLGNHGNERLHFRLRHGGIPNSSDERIKLPQITAVFYSANRKAAVADSAIMSGENVLLMGEVFLLRKRSGHWEVVQGPGGIGTFREAEKMLLSMKDLSLGELDVPPNTPSYCISPAEWDVPGSKFIPYQK
jgi:hypothetical protein